MQTETLIQKINKLPTERIYEVEDFVDFLQEKIARETKKARFHAIAEYAERHAESDVDLDKDLEQIAAEFLKEENGQ
jgi:hypothetical protein